MDIVSYLSRGLTCSTKMKCWGITHPNINHETKLDFRLVFTLDDDDEGLGAEGIQALGHG